MEYNIKPTFQVFINCTNTELHDLMSELELIVNKNDYDQYLNVGKLYDSLYLWFKNEKE